MDGQKILYAVIAAVGTGLSNDLLQKIREAEDPKGEQDMKIAVLTEDQWMLHRSLFRPYHRILFIGPIRGAEELSRGGKSLFERHGVHYIEKGSMAFLRVERSIFESKAEIELFRQDWNKECGFAVCRNGKSNGSSLPVLSMIAVALFVPLGYILVGGKLVKEHFNAAERLRRQKYMYGFTCFMKYHAKSFMKDAASGIRAELTGGILDRDTSAVTEPDKKAGATPEQIRAFTESFLRQMDRIYKKEQSGDNHPSDSEGRNMDLKKDHSSK